MRDVLLHAGIKDDKGNYAWHAEVAVAAYLGLALPPELIGALEVSGTQVMKDDGSHRDPSGELEEMARKKVEELSIQPPIFAKDGNASPLGTRSADTADSATAGNETTIPPLLDTLPDPFTYKTHMLYWHFARYDYDLILAAGANTKPPCSANSPTALTRQARHCFTTMSYLICVSGTTLQRMGVQSRGKRQNCGDSWRAGRREVEGGESEGEDVVG